MSSAHHPTAEATPDDVLAELGLRREEVLGLARQGFVSQEVRPAGVSLYKLRFRFGGRQRVKVLGTSAERAAAVQAALDRLQAGRRTQQQLRQLSRQIARRWRANRDVLVPQLDQVGCYFHGRTVRRRRAARPPRSSSF